MALSLGPVNFGNPSGLWALLALVPLIILYLIRPRPRSMAIPSLMFFMKTAGSKRLTSFFKQITKDWLFLIQLLLLLLLALTFAKPHSLYQHDVTAQNTVIVLDVSASSQVHEGARTRFDLSISKAKKVLGAKNTIILAKDVPLIALQDASYDQAATFLNGLTPKQTLSRIGEAIILAGEALSGEGRVAVISDFINTEGQTPEVAKAILESKGIIVDFINIADEEKINIGIIDLEAGNKISTVYVKNFDKQAHTVPLVVGGTTKELNIPAKSIESFTFKTPDGLTKVRLDVADDFGVDNYAHISAPQNGRARVLFIANNASVFLKNALQASQEFDITFAEPPVVPKGDFEIYIIQNVHSGAILPGTFENIAKKVEDGATAIVHVQETSDLIDYGGLLPVTLAAKSDGGYVSVDHLTRFTKNIEFGKADKIFAAAPKGNQSIIASVEDIPVITVKTLGKGKTVYYGLSESSEFKFLPSYPIFWTEIIKDSTESQDVKNLNFAAGDLLVLDKEQKIKTPTVTVKKSAMVLDEVGLYELEDRIIAVNLVNDRESTINLETQIGTKSIEYELRPVKETREFPWEYWMLAIAIMILLFEVWFVKMRGDV